MTEICINYVERGFDFLGWDVCEYGGEDHASKPQYSMEYMPKGILLLLKAFLRMR